jgi:hypothetical protein
MTICVIPKCTAILCIIRSTICARELRITRQSSTAKNHARRNSANVGVRVCAFRAKLGRTCSGCGSCGRIEGVGATDLRARAHARKHNAASRARPTLQNRVGTRQASCRWPRGSESGREGGARTSPCVSARVARAPYRGSQRPPRAQTLPSLTKGGKRAKGDVRHRSALRKIPLFSDPIRRKRAFPTRTIENVWW